MKKFVLKLDLHDGKEKQKALKTVSALPGIDSIAMDMKEKKLTVIGIVDPITTVSKLRKYWPTTVLISVGPAKEPEKPSEKKEGGEAAKPEDAGKKEEGKKDGNAGEEKKEEGKKEGDEKKEGGGGDEKKKVAPPQVIPLYDPMWEMKARGYNPHMFGYNNVPPMMTYYNPNHHHMAAYNPAMTSYYPPPPPLNTHYAHPMEENPNGWVSELMLW